MPDPVSELPPLRSLVGHREFVHATDPLESVHQRFAAGRHDYFAVLEGRRLLGLCSRREVGTLLGARYGFALYARAPVAGHLTAAEVRVTEATLLPAVLRAVAERRDEHFYDDVLLVDEQGEYLGLIYVRELVRLQNTLLLDNITELERRQQEIAARNRQMEEDLRMARQVQVALLPADFPACAGPEGRHLRFAQVFQPADGVSGDFFAVLPVSAAAAGLLMCDVMGHGVRSALVAAMIRSMTEELREAAADPGRFLTRLNAGLTRLLRRGGPLIFVTASYVVVDAAAGCLRLAHAGHPFPLRWSARHGAAAPLADAGRVGGPALGLIEDHEYEVAEVALEVGDRVVLFTDGLEEVADAAGQELGLAALGAAVAAGAAEPLPAMLDRVCAVAAAHSATGAFADDVCLLACEYAGAAEAPA